MQTSYTEQLGVQSAWEILKNVIMAPSIKATVALFSVCGEWLFGAHVEALAIVFFLIVLDTVTGIMKACKKGELSSKGFFRTMSKMAIYLVLMAMSSAIDKLLPIKAASSIMYSFLAITEAISIMENISLLGWPVPALLLKILHHINDKDNK